jgi:TonB family protein
MKSLAGAMAALVLGGCANRNLTSPGATAPSISVPRQAIAIKAVASTASPFFDSVKQRVAAHWDASGQLRTHSRAGERYVGPSRYTVLTVTLNDKGRLREAFVYKSCGLDFLDLEALRAFERAQPFPKPPENLIEADGLITFQFGFMLEVGPRLGEADGGSEGSIVIQDAASSAVN